MKFLNDSGTSVLQALDESRLFYVTMKDGFVVIGESCDGYFARKLTNEQFSKLILELQMIESKLL